MGAALRHATLKVTGEGDPGGRETFFGRRGEVWLPTRQLPGALPAGALARGLRAPRLDAALRSAFPQGLPFSKFDRRPIAVGSIAQVHRAELVNGERVIVKLVRPGLQREIDRDLNAAELLVDLLLKIPGYARKRTR